MFQRTKVFQLSPPRALRTMFSLLSVLSLSLSFAQFLLSVCVLSRACKCVYRYSALLCWYGFTARAVPSINKNFLLLEGFFDLYRL